MPMRFAPFISKASKPTPPPQEQAYDYYHRQRFNPDQFYLLRDEEIVAEHLLAVGVNSGKARSQGDFRDAIAAGISELLHANQLTTGDVRFAIASGMITSNLGLLEIPHITAPVSLEQLVSRVVKVKDPAILPLDLEIRFVPGIKNAQADRSWSSLRDIDLMRGKRLRPWG